jgi:hypothetical protein
MNQSLRHGTAVGLVGSKVTSNQLLLLQLVITGNPTKEIASETLKLITHTIAERKETQGRRHGEGGTGEIVYPRNTHNIRIIHTRIKEKGGQLFLYLYLGKGSGSGKVT